MALPLKRFHSGEFVYPLPKGRLRLLELEFKGILFFFDLLLLLACVLSGPLLRHILGKRFPSLPYHDLGYHLQAIFENFWLFLPIPFLFLWHRLYRRLPFWEEIKRLWLSLFEGFILVYALISLAKLSLHLSRLEIFFSFLCAVVFFPLYRYRLKWFLFSFKRYRIPALICPAGEESQALAQALSREKTLGYEVVGFLDDDPCLLGQRLAGFKVFGPLRQAGKFARLKGVDAVFILLNGKPFPRLEELYAYLQRHVGEIFFVPGFTSLGLFNAELAFLFSKRLSLIRVTNPLGSYLNRVLKRGLDLLGALSLLLLTFPFMLLIACAIKFDSEGPVIFSQERVGRGGKTFRIYKFRTMFVDAEERLAACLAEDPRRREQWKKFRKLDNDPRVTRVGRILRRLSLDELPQLINVLKGEMSLVGPRPAMAEEIEIYYRNKRHFYFAVRPGLTGLWQVSGRNLLSFQERIQLDIWYVQNWSLWLDFVILLRTVPAVFRCEGSY